MADENHQHVTVAVVLPVLNEARALEPLYKELRDVFAGTTYDYEFVFINDGSTDDTGDRLAALAEKDAAVRVVELARNFGAVFVFRPAVGSVLPVGRVLLRHLCRTIDRSLVRQVHSRRSDSRVDANDDCRIVFRCDECCRNRDPGRVSHPDS